MKTMASFASSATTGGARKHAWTNNEDQPLLQLNVRQSEGHLVCSPSPTMVHSTMSVWNLRGYQGVKMVTINGENVHLTVQVTLC